VTLELTEHERRILAYLDQHGPTHRSRVIADLANPASKWGRGQLSGRGSNNASPMIMANWCRRLTVAGLVKQRSRASEFHNRRGEHYKTLHFYHHHEITDAGRRKLREEQ
jgi:hypothetical protein